MDQDRSYFYERAEVELRLAQQATQPEVVKADYQLAGYYLDQVYGAGDQTDLPSDQTLEEPLSQPLRGKADRLAAQLRSAGVIIVGPFVSG